MPYDPERHHRRSIRLKDFDSQSGAYFITICTRERERYLAEIVDGKAILTDAGLIVSEIWQGLPARFAGVGTDAFIVMPNHVHGILIVGAQFIAPETSRPAQPSQGALNRAPTLGECVRTFKAASTRQIRMRGVADFAWQRNYYERIIRDDEQLATVTIHRG